MQLTVRDVSKLLKISERTIYRWINEKSIPAYKIHDQYRFNRAELLEWVTAKKITVSPELFQEPEDQDSPLPKLIDALKIGGIHYRLAGENKAALLKSVVDVLNLPEKVDRNFLLQVILAREELASTGVGDGIAIPHPRSPIVLNVPSAMMAVCFLEKPIDFGAYDGKPVHCLFIIVTATVRIHLHMLSKLAYALKDPAFKNAIMQHGPREEIFKAAENVEKCLST